jgi:hypothetical protein
MIRFSRKRNFANSPTIQARVARDELRNAALVVCERLEERTLFNAGGGWTGGGIVGDYYNNGSFSGSPTFSRTDVRIDFTPGSEAPGGGLSSDPSFGAIHTATDWSAVWQGTLIPKYTETYTLKEMIGSGDAGAVYFGTGAQGSNPLLLSGSGRQSAQITLTAGQDYNLEMTYVHNGGSTWQAQLHWLSNGKQTFSEEAIEPASLVGENAPSPEPEDPSGFADAALGATYTGTYGDNYVDVYGNLITGNTTISSTASPITVAFGSLYDGENIQGSGLTEGTTIASYAATTSTTGSVTYTSITLSEPATYSGYTPEGLVANAGAVIDSSGQPTGDFALNNMAPSTTGPTIYKVNFTGAAQVWANATATQSDGQINEMFFTGNDDASVSSFAGTLAPGSTTIADVVASGDGTLYDLFVGETLNTAGLPAGTTVTAITPITDGATVTISNAATVSTVTSTTFSGSEEIDGQTYYPYGSVWNFGTTGEPVINKNDQTWNAATGTGYNPADNQTTILLEITNPYYTNIAFSQTYRNGYGAPGGPTTAGTTTVTGVTNLSIMGPTTSGGSTDYAAGTVFNSAYLQDLAPYTVIRSNSSAWDLDQTDANNNTDWSNRPLPSTLDFEADSNYGYNSPSDNVNGGNPPPPWEELILQANETGKDLYINVPGTASETYVTQLADLLKNGDTVNGVNYPGLLPNLNIYIEFSNEVWNGSGPNTGLQTAFDDAQSADTLDYQQYLQIEGSSYFDPTVWSMIRTKDISDIFRSVYGNAEMPSSSNGVQNADPRIRPLLEWQSNGLNFGYTAPSQLLTDLQTEFGNDANYYLYGGGGGWYADDNDPASTVSQLFSDLPTLMSTDVNSSADGTQGLDISGMTQENAAICVSFGLEDVGYEGGFDFGNSGNGQTPAQNSASTNTSITPYVTETLDQFFAAGGNMAIVYNGIDDTGAAEWPVLTNVYAGVTPKLQGYINEAQTLPPQTLAERYLVAGDWPLSDDSGTVATDTSVNGENATLEGGATWTTASAVGDGAIDVGANGYAVTSTSASLPTGSEDSTITFWFNSTELYNDPSSEYSYLAGYGNGLSDNVNIFLSQGGSYYYPYPGNTQHNENTTHPLVPDAWNFLALTYDGGTNTDTVYLNGAEISSQNAGTIFSDLNAGQVDIDFPGLYHTPGVYDDMRIYTKTLTPAQIALLYAVPTVTTSVSPGQVSLSWTSISGATSYDLYRSTSPGGVNSTPLVTGITTTTYADASVVGGTTYYYSVVPIDTSLAGSSSAQATATPPPQATLLDEWPLNSTLAPSTGSTNLALFNGGSTSYTTSTPTQTSLSTSASFNVNSSGVGALQAPTDLNLSSSSNYSISLWFNTANYDAYSELLGVGEYWTNNGYMAIRLGQDGYLELDEQNLSGGEAYFGASVANLPAAGSWVNVVATIDNTAGTAALYVDGQFFASTTSNTIESGVSWSAKNITSAPVTLGYRYGAEYSEDQYTGLLSDPQMYGGILTQQEADAIYTTGAP